MDGVTGQIVIQVVEVVKDIDRGHVAVQIVQARTEILNHAQPKCVQPGKIGLLGRNVAKHVVRVNDVEKDCVVEMELVLEANEHKSLANFYSVAKVLGVPGLPGLAVQKHAAKESKDAVDGLRIFQNRKEMNPEFALKNHVP